METFGEIHCCDTGCIPTDFIVDNIRYQKQFDANYHMFIVGSPTRPDSSIGFITIGEAEYLYNSIKYKKPIVICSNSVNIVNNDVRSIMSLDQLIKKYLNRIKNTINNLKE